ncbi:MAG: DHHA1 domain-containing protein [Candidatus Aenigmatarchaeota archaeon]
MEITAITHGDADGIISLSLFMKKFLPKRIYFSSSTKLKDVLCSSLIGVNGKILYIFDIAADEKTILLSSLYEKAVWIDHHEWQIKEIPKNVEVFLENSPSTAQLVAKHFEINSELVEIANEIDTSNINSDSASFFRDLVAAVKWKYSGSYLISKLRSISKTLTFHRIESFESDQNLAELLNEYYDWKKRIEEKILENVKTFEINGNKIAVYETTFQIPIYIVSNKLLEHEKAPFDFVAVIIHKKTLPYRISSKIELRTHTGKNVYDIARKFGGGGHKFAAGFTTDKFLKIDEFLKVLSTNKHRNLNTACCENEKYIDQEKN